MLHESHVETFAGIWLEEASDRKAQTLSADLYDKIVRELGK